LKPVLVPAWSLSLTVRATWCSSPGRTVSRKTRHERVNVPASDRLDGAVADALVQLAEGPFVAADAADLVEWEALPADVPLATAWRRTFDLAAALACEEAALATSLQRGDDLSVETRFEDCTARPLLLPAWMATYDATGRRGELLVDAADGRTCGQAPWDAPRLAAATAALGGVAGAACALLARLSG
jgi:hypothetical protein